MATYHEKRSSDGEECLPSVILQDEHTVELVRFCALNTTVRVRTTNMPAQCRLHHGGVSLVAECHIPATTAFFISEV